MGPLRRNEADRRWRANGRRDRQEYRHHPAVRHAVRRCRRRLAAIRAVAAALVQYRHLTAEAVAA